MITSPCIDVCKMDEASGLCQGCYRRLDEIEDVQHFRRATLRAGSHDG